jgi:hypothetical protein
MRSLRAALEGYQLPRMRHVTPRCSIAADGSLLLDSCGILQMPATAVMGHDPTSHRIVGGSLEKRAQKQKSNRLNQSLRFDQRRAISNLVMASSRIITLLTSQMKESLPDFRLP